MIKTLDTLPADAAPASAKRLSTDPADPGFALYQAARAAVQAITVFVDGLEVKHVVTADEGEGFVQTLIVSLSGDVMSLPNGQPRKAIRRGAVRIVVR